MPADSQCQTFELCFRDVQQLQCMLQWSLYCIWVIKYCERQQILKKMTYKHVCGYNNLEHNISVAKQLNINSCIRFGSQCRVSRKYIPFIYFVLPRNKGRTVSLRHNGIKKAYTKFTKIKLYMLTNILL